MSMQFWGVEVKAKEPCKVDLEFGNVIHLSQATLSDPKKDNEPVVIHVNVENKKHVLGILSQSTPQLSFDLVFHTDFEISHNFKNGSVHFLGYQTEMPVSDDELDSDESSDEEEVPVLQRENGTVAAPTPVAAAKAKVAAKSVKGTPVEEDSDEDDSDEDDSDEEMTPFSTSEFDSDSDDDEEDDDDESESEDEKPAKAPAKAESGKKRPNADTKTPESKKAKLVTPQKSDGKKGGAHTATPHPSKKGSKTPGGDKSTPKSAGQASCEPCKKTFNSDVALQSHNKAKHAAK